VRDGDDEIMLAGDTSYLESTMLSGTVDGVSPDEAMAGATLAGSAGPRRRAAVRCSGDAAGRAANKRSGDAAPDWPSCCSHRAGVTACTLALSPIRDTHSEGFSYFVTSIAAPVASGWSGRRVGSLRLALPAPYGPSLSTASRKDGPLSKSQAG
jgi:hypothetical protein